MCKDYEGSSARKFENRMEEELAYCWEHGVRVPLPEIFKPTFGGLFDTCLVCKEALLVTMGFHYGENHMLVDVPYLVFKEFRYGETRVEYGMCLDCFEAIRKRFSAATIAKMDALFQPVAEFRTRFDMLTQSYAPVGMWLDSCLLTGDRLDGAAESMVQGICLGEDLVLCSLPYAIAGRGVGLYENCFDKDSLKVIRKFVQKHFGVESVVYGR